VDLYFESDYAGALDDTLASLLHNGAVKDDQGRLWPMVQP
jgi:hypothetical protein